MLVAVAWAIVARSFAPAANTALTRFDVLIVLGSPADNEGNPTPKQLSRVTEAVHEYERGVAPRLLLTGGAAYNRFTEARVMARAAEAQGVPASAIVVESNAMDTIQNVCYSDRIMKEHGWRSAEVISTDTHLPRAALILGHYPLQWRIHAAPPLAETSPRDARIERVLEVVKTMRYLLYSNWAERCSP
jgi:uncharacterized SAM-binding protein YcdF (DUF218 family)